MKVDLVPAVLFATLLWVPPVPAFEPVEGDSAVSLPTFRPYLAPSKLFADWEAIRQEDPFRFEFTDRKLRVNGSGHVFWFGDRSALPPGTLEDFNRAFSLTAPATAHFISPAEVAEALMQSDWAKTGARGRIYLEGTERKERIPDLSVDALVVLDSLAEHSRYSPYGICRQRFADPGSYEIELASGKRRTARGDDFGRFTLAAIDELSLPARIRDLPPFDLGRIPAGDSAYGSKIRLPGTVRGWRLLGGFIRDPEGAEALFPVDQASVYAFSNPPARNFGLTIPEHLRINTDPQATLTVVLARSYVGIGRPEEGGRTSPEVVGIWKLPMQALREAARMDGYVLLSGPERNGQPSFLLGLMPTAAAWR